MEEYKREMAEVKTLVATTLEKNGTLPKLRAQLRASIFEAVEEHDRLTTGSGASSVVAGCSEQAKTLHGSAIGKLLSNLTMEYLEWAELEHTAKVYSSECNLPAGRPTRAILEQELSLTSGGSAAPGVSQGPLLLDVLQTYLNTKAASTKVITNTSSFNGTRGSVLSPGTGSARNARSNSPTIRRDSLGGFRSISPQPRIHRVGGTTPIARSSSNVTNPNSGGRGDTKANATDKS